MVLSTIILLLLIISIVHGYRKGLLSMVLSVLTYIISYYGAKYLAPHIGDWLAGVLPEISHGTAISGNDLIGLNLSQFFYRGIAFIIGFAIFVAILKLLLRRLKWISKLPILGIIDRWLGAGLNLVIVYVILFVLLMVLQLYPAGWWQAQLASSEIAQVIIKETPFLTQTVINLLG
ncbi:MAG: CvpA family protein [Limosilactobacillus sp.]|uniref:CvpA family protein n=1 Tax=Limosilactobacillus sp. TaxID=2773925 RepID=UPI0025C61D0D|nr:CvpA family protein [Limosilactobacillus sp.]MCI1975372.1 CvpA family protein [Limosilactobacillus sp.]MCI2031133.1 CvpA family protein [Limosilactobacillus sp.]